MERIEKLQNMLVESPGDNFLQHALALEFIKQGRDDEAETLFTSILHADPGYTGSYYHLARLYERQQKIPEAITVYEKGMEACKEKNEMHNLYELTAAYEDLTF
ncbi:MAG: tetratricopeptide repeat protein [Ferruginibacter sp.]